MVKGIDAKFVGTDKGSIEDKIRDLDTILGGKTAEEYAAQIADVENQIQNNSSDILTNKNDISTLDNRVTDIENNGVGGGDSVLSEDTTVTIPAGSTISEIQSIFDLQPKNLGGHALTIQFEDGTYTFDTRLTVTGFYNGRLYIYGNSNDFVKSDTKSVVINSTGLSVNITLNEAAIYFYGFRVNTNIESTGAYTPAFAIDFTDKVNIHYCSFHDSGQTYSLGLDLNFGAVALIQDCYIDTHHQGLSLYGMCQANLRNTDILNIGGSGILAYYGSKVSKCESVTSPSESSLYGGQIF